MKGVSIIETETLNKLMVKIENLETTVLSVLADLKNAKRRYLTVKEVKEITGFSTSWVHNNKADIGFTKVTGGIRFRWDDVEEYMQKNYFKA